MAEKNQIGLSEWEELAEEEKEVLRLWATKHKIGLEIIPSATESFDPSCDYAAFLTREQMQLFLKEFAKDEEDNDACDVLWYKVKKALAERD